MGFLEVKQMPKKRSLHFRVQQAMKSLGVYKPEFEPIIEIYCQLRDQYDVLTIRFVESEYDFQETTDSGSKKAPIVTTLEALRRDLLSYAAQLGLTAQGLQKLDETAFAKKKADPLAALLAGVKDGGGKAS